MFFKRKFPLYLLFSISLFIFHHLFPQEPQTTHSIQMAQDALDWDGWLTIGIFILIFLGLVTEVRPPDIVMLLGTGSLVIFGVLKPIEFLEGFSNEILITIAMLCVIVRAMEVNGVLEVVGRRVLAKTKSFTLQMLSMCIPVSIGSAFLNNTPIVLLMTPIVRKWAHRNQFPPSKFLIPLSYAALLGGACTLIGTSTNLVVYSLLKQTTPEAAYSFFELAYVGVPCAIVGLLYLVFFSNYLLPVRVDPRSAISEETREFTAEFLVGPDCPLANKTIKEASRRYLRGETLIQVERNNALIDSPNQELVIFVGDRLVFAGDIHQIAELHAIKDLQSQADPHFSLDVSSSHFSEVVIPTTSLLIGKTLRHLNFRNAYGASVLAIYRQGWRVHGDVRDVVIQSGDTLMLLSGEPWTGANYYTKDFYFIRHHEKLVAYHPWKSIFVVLTLFAMVTAATMGVSLFIASMTAVFLLFATRAISLREAQNSIIWDILLLIACSFALGKAMETTGVAAYFAEIILSVVGTNPYMLVGGIVMVAIICTEFMTNNAAALILFPIAITAAKLAGYHSIDALKAIGISVAVGASCGYAVPTGYQTHMIVYGPGGYKFTDFLKMGIIMDVLIWLVSSYLIPTLWPLR